MNKKALSLLIASVTILCAMAAVLAQTGYRDVPDSAPYAAAVEYCRANGLMEGTSEREFSPEERTTRAMLVTILHRRAGSPAAAAPAFADVESGAWYYDAVAWAADTGLVEGYDATRFGPQDLLTREQILSVLWRADGSQQAGGAALPFADSGEISDYALDAVNWAYAAGIVGGESPTLSPQGAVTRADMAVILFRYLNGPEETPAPSPDADAPAGSETATPDVHVRFGTAEFDVVLYESATKELLMAQLSPSEMMLPPSYDAGGGYKYYDIPSRYLSYMGIETAELTEVKAGELLLNDEGRLFLYYEDAAVQGSFMRAGYVTEMDGVAEALGDGTVTFYVSQYTGPENSSGPVSGQVVSLSEQTVQLGNGFSAVRYAGDDLFDKFLAQGGAGSDAEVIQFLQHEMGRDAAGLELELDGFACSTLAAEEMGGGKLFGRNFDWNRCNALVTVSNPVNGYASIATVNTDFIKTVYREGFDSLPENVRTLVSLYAPLDGMNEKGLCAAVLMIQDTDTVRQDTGKPGITTTTAVRMLLNNAATVDEAVELLRQYDFHASFGYMLHFALSDASGKSVAVEYVGQEMVVTETPVLTNFYVSEGRKNGIGTAQSHTRFDLLQNTLAQQPVMTGEDMKNAMESVSKRHFNDGTSTEWSIVYHKTTGMATYYHRENFEQPYTFALQ